MEIKDLKRSVDLLRSSVPNKKTLDDELVNLQINLIQCQETLAVLEHKLEDPSNAERVRLLTGNDPSFEDLEEKIDEVNFELNFVDFFKNDSTPSPKSHPHYIPPKTCFFLKKTFPCIYVKFLTGNDPSFEDLEEKIDEVNLLYYICRVATDPRNPLKVLNIPYFLPPKLPPEFYQTSIAPKFLEYKG